MTPTLLGISVFIFVIMHLMPGDVVLQMLAESASFDPANEEAIRRRRLGLDRPLTEQYLAWGFGLLQFDLGTSLWTGQLSASSMRMMRSTMLEVIRQDYIRTARAKGLREYTVIMGHALKNAMIPVVTIIGDQAIIAVGGSVIIETVFGLPGVGRLLVESITRRDLTMVQGVVMFFALFVVVANLVVDLSYA